MKQEINRPHLIVKENLNTTKRTLIIYGHKYLDEKDNKNN